jgi:hypothetical protein
MPAEGLEWLPGPALLTDDEVSRLVSVTVRRLGITEVRFTGASRLLPGAAAIIAPTAALEPRPEISLTTNGIGLARLAQPLRAAAAAPLGRLAGRTVGAGASLAEVQRAMNATWRRRAAVTSDDGRLLGLLCLKASRAGFCSELDVRARAEAGTAVVGGR